MINNDNNIRRREFLKRVMKAGLTLASFGLASYIMYDKSGPGSKRKTNDNVKLPDYSVKPVEGKNICIVKGNDRAKSLEKAINLLGGIDRFVKPGETVAIKPNVAFASSPDLGATSHPAIVEAVIRLCIKAGAVKVLVLDNPINAPSSCFYLSGIDRAVNSAGGEIILPEPGLFRNTTLANGRLINDWPILYEPLKEADKLIGLAPVKSHHRSGASMTMKNWYGLLGGRRNIFHQDIHNIISELAQLVKPTLVILDGVDVMMSNGPTGGSVSDLKRMNTLIVSLDQVAADAYGASLLGKKISDLPFIGKAEASGAGTSDFKSLNPIFTEAG